MASSGATDAAAATSADMDVVPIAPRSPNLNAKRCERFLGDANPPRVAWIMSCSNVGQDHLRRVVAEWVGHFNGGRPHQGIGQRIDEPAAHGRAA